MVSATTVRHGLHVFHLKRRLILTTLPQSVKSSDGQGYDGLGTQSFNELMVIHNAHSRGSHHHAQSTEYAAL